MTSAQQRYDFARRLQHSLLKQVETKARAMARTLEADDGDRDGVSVFTHDLARLVVSVTTVDGQRDAYWQMLEQDRNTVKP